MYMTLYRKYRPQTFSEVAGEKEIIQAIRNALKNNRLAHAYLFAGPRGVGKTTVARLIAKGVNCLNKGITDDPCNKCFNCNSIMEGNFSDLVEIDAASNRGIDEIRLLKDNINYQPIKGRKKVYIIDEVHMLTKEAFNALLKTLEEPPSHVIFILATTEPEKILDTIISRCQRYDFKTFTYNETKLRLLEITKNESVNIDDESIEIIYEKSKGSLRDAISLLEKVISSHFDQNITKEKVAESLGVISEEKFELFIGFINESNKKKCIKFLDDLWHESVDLDMFFKDFAYYLKNEILKNKSNVSIDIGINMIKNIYEVISKFKYEEDKRLVGYVVLSKLFENASLVNTEILEIKEKKNEFTLADSKENNMEKNLIKKIKNSWKEILIEAKEKKVSLIAFLAHALPIKILDTTLVISFPKEDQFHSEIMNSSNYKSTLLEAIQNKFSNIKDLKFVVQNSYTHDKKNENESQDIIQDVLNFFDGDII